MLPKSNFLPDLAGVNTVTALLRAYTKFGGADDQSVRVPGDNRPTGGSASTQLRGSDLNGVNSSETRIPQEEPDIEQVETLYVECHTLNASPMSMFCAFSPENIHT